jgi:pimeloyl-ACP methyl ester carboxylesterase
MGRRDEPAAAADRARLEMDPADGHSVFIESPEQCNREISKFAASLTRFTVKE